MGKEPRLGEGALALNVPPVEQGIPVSQGGKGHQVCGLQL